MSSIVLRPAIPADDAAIGALLVSSYAALPGMPGPAEQPAYYQRLADVAARRADPALEVYVATDDTGRVLGSVDLVIDLSAYGAGPKLDADGVGLRLLAVDAAARGRGVGRRLTELAIVRARALGRRRVVLHTTRSMGAAWRLYEGLGFGRRPAMDFRQGELEVFGFALELEAEEPMTRAGVGLTMAG